MSDKFITEDIAVADPKQTGGQNERVGGKIKTMAQLGSTQPDREVLASPNTVNPVVPGNYHEFNGSQSKMYETYPNRMAKIAAALGNKSALVS